MVIPNLVGMGKIIYIQGNVNDERNLGLGQQYGLFPHRDKVLDRLINEEYHVEEIVKYIERNLVFTREEIKGNFRELINKFLEREKKWDVKIIDYILDVYKSVPTFYDINHPFHDVIREISQRILKELGISENSITSLSFPLKDYEMLIYKEIAQVLGLKYWQENYELRKNLLKKLSERMSWKEYVKEYVFWCHERNKITVERISK